MLLPFVFEPYLKSVLWGGTRIAAYKGWPTQSRSIGESWEISAMPGRESVVKAGPERGMRLSQLVEKYGADLLGERVWAKYGTDFPLIVKLIDARRDLSLQVHPNDDLARRRHQDRGKTEMWYVVRADEGAAVYAGFSRTLTPEEYDIRAAGHTLMETVARYASHPGDVFYLPAGCIHSLTAGNMVVEVQQASDVTYRVYDYDRLDADGKPRELHTDLAREALNYQATDDLMVVYDHDAPDITGLVNGPYFKVARIRLRGSLLMPDAREAFVVLMCVEGKVKMDMALRPDFFLELHAGETVLVPAASPSLRMEGEATLLQISV